MWSPLVDNGCLEKKNLKIGIVGIGGLGTMGLKLAKAMGHEVVAFTRSKDKIDVCKKKGADEVCVTGDPESLKQFAYSCDLIIDTVAVHHDIMSTLSCLKKKGTLSCVGGIPQPMNFNQFFCIFNKLSIQGSLIGGIKATEDCVAFCAKHQIWPDISVIGAKDISMAWEQLDSGKNNDGTRYVIDIKKSLEDKEFISK